MFDAFSAVSSRYTDRSERKCLCFVLTEVDSKNAVGYNRIFPPTFGEIFKPFLSIVRAFAVETKRTQELPFSYILRQGEDDRKRSPPLSLTIVHSLSMGK